MAAVPSISVVMPVYNGGRFLREAVDSILRQTCTDFELLLVDDGSTDDTPAIAAQAAGADPRIRVITQSPNQGVVAARNLGARQARGTFIAIMDSDDVAVPDRLERQLAFLRAYPEIAAVGGSVRIIDLAGTPGAIKRYPASPGLVAWSMLFFNGVAHSTLMLRREAHGDGYPAGGAEDYGLTASIASRARLANLPDVLVSYRVWPGGLTQRTWEKQEAHATSIVQDLASRTAGHPVSERQAVILRGLSRNQFPHDRAEIAATADLIRELSTVCVRRFADRPDEAREIRRDAGVRLWLLAALAARGGALGLATSTAGRALAQGPGAMAAFLKRAWKNVRP